jgi:hypothetical protein
MGVIRARHEAAAPKQARPLSMREQLLHRITARRGGH